MLSFKPAFSLSCFTFIKRLFSSPSLSAIRVVSSAYLRLGIFLQEDLKSINSYNMGEGRMISVWFFLSLHSNTLLGFICSLVLGHHTLDMYREGESYRRSLFNMLSSLVIAFPPRSKCSLISWLQSPSTVMLEPPK